MTQPSLLDYIPPAPRASRRDGPASSVEAEGRARRDPRNGTERARVLDVLRRHPDSTAAELATLLPPMLAYEVRRHLWHLARIRPPLAVVTGEETCDVAGTIAQTWSAT